MADNSWDEFWAFGWLAGFSLQFYLWGRDQSLLTD